MKISKGKKKDIFLKMIDTVDADGQVVLSNGSILNKQQVAGYVITSHDATDTEGSSVAYGLDKEALFNDMLSNWYLYIGYQKNIEPLVTENGIITTDEPLFMCCWNGDDYQIHTRTTLWENFHETNLFEHDEDGWRFEGYHQNNVNFNILLKRISCPNFDVKNAITFCNDNMTIRRIK